MNERNNPKSQYSWIGPVVTVLLIVWGIYVIFKFYKSPGFWAGVASVFLLTSYLIIDSDGFRYGAAGMTLDTSKKNYDPNGGIKFT